MKFKTTVQIEIEVDADYTPGREAPACSNPSDPRFSDSGDSLEIEVLEMYIVNGDKKIKIPVDICDVICDTCIDELMDKADETHLNDFCYAMARKVMMMKSMTTCEVI